MLHAVDIRSLARSSLIELRGDAAAVARVAAACGLPLPRQANREAAAGGIAVAWIGPRRWLVIAPAADEAALVARLECALADEALLDMAVVSDMFACLAVGGEGAIDVLAQGCALDLEGDALPVGGITGTEMWQVGVILRRVEQGFEILVDRSLEGFLENWLVTAAGGRPERIHAATQFFRG